MKTNLYALITLTALGSFSGFADEQATLTKSSHPDNAAQDYAQRLGVGIIIGEPTGGSLKYWFNDTLAIDGAVGWSSHDHTDLYLHSDVLWHNFELIPVSKGRLPIYIGAGGLFRLRDDNRDNQAGVRLPVGVSYMFENAPVDIFAEIAPAVDVTPDVRGELTGGIGIRFWF